MCQTGSRKCAADDTDIDQLQYLNAKCLIWVFNYISMVSCPSSHQILATPLRILTWSQQNGTDDSVGGQREQNQHR